MTSTNKNFAIIFSIFAIAAAASAAFLWSAGNTDDNINWLLRQSARAAFLIYLVVFIARPLRAFVVNDLSGWLLKNRRSLGVAFAATHIAHLGLIAYRFNVNPDITFSYVGSIPGMIAYTFIALMLITSFDGPTRAIGPKKWRVLHKTGLYYIGLIFTATLLPGEEEPLINAERALLVPLLLIAIGIRIGAFVKKRSAAAT